MRLLPPLHHRRVVNQSQQVLKDSVDAHTKHGSSSHIDGTGDGKREDRRIIEALGATGLSDSGMEDVIVEVEARAEEVHVLPSPEHEEVINAMDDLANEEEKEALYGKGQLVNRLMDSFQVFEGPHQTSKCQVPGTAKPPPCPAAHEDEPMVDESFLLKADQLGEAPEDIDDDVDDAAAQSWDDDDDKASEYSPALDDDEEEEDDNGEENNVASRAYHKGFSPPEAYLPLPTPCLESPYDPPRYQLTLGISHGVPRQTLTEHFNRDKRELDAARAAAFQVYQRLPSAQSCPPIMTRLRRRLIRLIGHATLAHHRGRHEVIFQTVYLFDLVISSYVGWVWSKVPATLCPDPLVIRSASAAPTRWAPKSNSLSLISYLLSLGSPSSDMTQSNINSADVADLSRLSTTTSMTEATPVVDTITKEELRTVMVACLLLASKWNNSRYLPPSVLCSPPVGRVCQPRVLDLEVGILSTFQFNIPFKTSLMNHMSLILDHHEEGLVVQPMTNNLCFNLALMILELSLGDHKSLQFSVDQLTQSSVWLALSLVNAVSPTEDAVYTKAHLLMAPDNMYLAISFHLKNVESEILSAVSALPKLQSLGRWANQREAPNVFGVPISTRMPSALSPDACLLFNEHLTDQHKTKTESLALEFLRGSYAVAFDILVAAVLKDGHRQPHRMWTTLPETAELQMTYLHQQWVSLKTKFNAIV